MGGWRAESAMSLLLIIAMPKDLVRSTAYREVSSMHGQQLKGVSKGFSCGENQAAHSSS